MLNIRKNTSNFLLVSRWPPFSRSTCTASLLLPSEGAVCLVSRCQCDSVDDFAATVYRYKCKTVTSSPESNHLDYFSYALYDRQFTLFKHLPWAFVVSFLSLYALNTSFVPMWKLRVCIYTIYMLPWVLNCTGLCDPCTCTYLTLSHCPTLNTLSPVYASANFKIFLCS